ncbi:Uncharacterized protein TCM_002339 [Theobroma cacao]|uniref:Uncharacterized protein n=1 Tax=Theobroma cacao TaxID=3641 RepID=A0A061DU02_THECC|nr:Uncharacterized protein TCM_002339 [Theobroma cacao]
MNMLPRRLLLHPALEILLMSKLRIKIIQHGDKRCLKDVLHIPVSEVTSKSALSVAGEVLSQYHSSLARTKYHGGNWLLKFEREEKLTSYGSYESDKTCER